MSGCHRQLSAARTPSTQPECENKASPPPRPRRQSARRGSLWKTVSRAGPPAPSRGPSGPQHPRQSRPLRREVGLQTSSCISTTAPRVRLCLLHQGLSPLGKSLGGRLPPALPFPAPRTGSSGGWAAKGRVGVTSWVGWRVPPAAWRGGARPGDGCARPCRSRSVAAGPWE